MYAKYPGETMQLLVYNMRLQNCSSVMVAMEMKHFHAGISN